MVELSSLRDIHSVLKYRKVESSVLHSRAILCRARYCVAHNVARSTTTVGVTTTTTTTTTNTKAATTTTEATFIAKTHRNLLQVLQKRYLIQNLRFLGLEFRVCSVEAEGEEVDGVMMIVVTML